MYSVILVLSVIASALAQNENCPLCSLGYPPPPNFHQQQQSMENQHTIFLPTSFGSYPTQVPQSESMLQPSSPSSTIFGGNAQAFGTELGKAIAQRIQQIYASPSMQQQFQSQNGQQQHLPPMNLPQNFNSYPAEQTSQAQRQTPMDSAPITFNPPHHPYTGQLMNTLPGFIPPQNQMTEPLNYRNIVEQPPLQKSCPYCFGNQYGQMASRKKKS